MSDKRNFRIAVLPGDGIGPEVIDPCLKLLSAVTEFGGQVALEFETLEAGAGHYSQTGTSIPESTFSACRKADAILLGAMGLPHIRYPDGTEISPQLELREELELFAGVRPIKTFEGIPTPLASPRAKTLDSVLVRESTEGLFAARGKCELENDSYARDTMVISRPTCEKLFDYAFKTARKRKAQGHPGRVTCIDKANVLGSFAFFRKIFDERALLFPDVVADHCYVDAAGLRLVKNPWDFDVMVTENMFGDILSDVGAGLMGGMGMAPSADIGSEYAVFQPCHGSAPDIAGQKLANPIATFLSAALMLEWLGESHNNEACSKGAQLIVHSIRTALKDGSVVPTELGGRAGTLEIFEAVMAEVPRPQNASFA